MNNSTPNWGKLVRENRVKAPGIPWTDDELKAIHEKKMDPEDVRNGFLDQANVEESKKEDELPTRYWNKAKLIATAKEMGLQFDESAATRGDLILEIEQQLERDASAEGKTGGEDAEKSLGDK